METTINFNDLPKNILQQIPLSLRIAQDTYVFDDLPNDIKYLLSTYKLNTQTEIDYSNVIELRPETSIYNDLETIVTVKETIIEYLVNHLTVLTGSYPYDVTVGSGLKKHLQTKDTVLRNTLVFNEIQIMIAAMSNRYQLEIAIVGKKFKQLQYEDRTEIELTLTLKIEDDEFEVTLN